MIDPEYVTKNNDPITHALMVAQAEADFTALIDRLTNKFVSKIEALAFLDWAMGDLAGRIMEVQHAAVYTRQDIIDQFLEPRA
jgi:hypothetical protein